MADVPVDGTDINRSLDNWKTHRALLATTIKSYLAACADFNTACACASHQIYDRKDLESALAVIDAELTGLASEEESLRPARISLSASRNLSSALAPIHSLPLDILTRIFAMMPSTNSFTGISSYWRQVALSTPTLWTRMGIRDQNRRRYGYLCLERSNGFPLQFYVVGEDSIGLSERWLAFFKKALPQIRMLDLWARRQHLRHTNVNIVLETWLKNGFVGTTKVLRLRAAPSSAAPWDLDAWSIERAEAMLSPLTVLHLTNILIPCSSAAYHGLVDLRLSTEGRRNTIELSVSQLAGILSASPNLSSLNITGVKVLPSDSPKSPTFLVHLKLLCLFAMDDESLGLVMSLIPLSRCLEELSVGLSIGRSNGHLVENFLRGARIKTLACMTFGEQPGQWPLLLSTVVHPLDHLIIRGFEPLKPLDIETLRVELEERKAENRLNKGFPFPLPHVYLASGRYDDDDLTFITRMLSVQKLHVERCTKLESQGKLNRLEAKLPETPPNSVCTFTEMDTTAEWLCCRVFDLFGAA
ncbi:hypothetical protein FRC10_011969 [Ceratobasidium sp. 414]|nr:hypothetical protein FRC10_011969 [Ceratobasidium sp. 414]